MRMMNWGLRLATLAAVVGCGHAAVIYDAERKNLPADQKWIYLAQPSPGSATQANPSGYAARLNSLAATADKTGWFSKASLGPVVLDNLKLGTLDRAVGFTINLRMRLLDEVHNSNDRAGFSIIALAGDLRGIEIGFWRNEIWAQADAPLFTHAEGVAGNFAGKVLRLSLTIQGDTYTLRDQDRVLLSGALRNYSSFGAPYNIPSFLFFGDDTTSAAADVEVSRIGLNDTATLAPQLALSPSSITGRDMVVTFREPGTYRWQATADLLSWDTLDTRVSLSGTAPLADVAAGPRRFYRVIMDDPPLP